MNEKAFASFDYYRKKFNHITRRGDECGLTYGQMDVCFQIGYNKVRRS